MSSEFGITITIGNKWRAWHLIPGWEGQQDISWAEAIVFECLVGYLLDNKTCRQNYMVYGDNKGLVEGLWNARSCNRAINNVFKWVYKCLQRDMTRSSIHMLYISSKYNPANTPSSIPSPSTNTTPART